MKLLKIGLLLFAFTVVNANNKYGNIPTDGYVKISVTDSKNKNGPIESSPNCYFVGYTYSKNQNGELVLRIPEAEEKYDTNHDSYVQLMNWIEQTEESKKIDICKEIKKVNGKDGYDWKHDICFILKDVKMTTTANANNTDEKMFLGVGIMMSLLIALLIIGIISISLLIHFLPTIIAMRRKHKHLTAIFILNLYNRIYCNWMDCIFCMGIQRLMLIIN